MEELEFTKYQALGNDFIVTEDLKSKFDFTSSQVVNLCRRHFGVGADGLIVARPSEAADFFMLFFNPDGSQAEMCGNGIRCLAKHLYERQLCVEKSFNIETLAGIHRVALTLKEGKVAAAKVDMGEPTFSPSEVPVKSSQEIISDYLETSKGPVQVTVLSMGNPHCVIFVESADNAPVKTLGTLIEHLEIFPKRTNVEFAEAVSQGEINLRVWERGAGETLACGTGACAAVVAAVKCGLTGHAVIVHLPGGDLKIEWASDNHVYLTGPVVEVFKGKVDLATLEVK